MADGWGRHLRARMSCRRGCSWDVGGQPMACAAVRGSAAGRSGDGKKGAGMNQWPCCFIDDGARPASHVLARTIATRQLEWEDTTGEYGPREGARLIRSEMEVASVRSANEVPRSSAAARVAMGSA